jgi:predicted nuclease with TOPRIM domain
MNKNLLITLSLIAGLITGYWFHAYTSVGKIEKISTELDEQEDRYLSLLYKFGQVQEKYTSLKNNYTDLAQRYNELLESESIKENDALLDDYTNLSNRISYLDEYALKLEAEIDALINEKKELQEKYLKLLTNYYENEILSWTYMEVQDLRVNLTVVTNNYMTLEDVEGTIGIYYINKEPFNGTVKLTLWNRYLKMGTTSENISINGETSYVFDYPFFCGPGVYILGISEIRDSSGHLMVSKYQVTDYFIPIHMYNE